MNGKKEINSREVKIFQKSWLRQRSKSKIDSKSTRFFKLPNGILFLKQTVNTICTYFSATFPFRYFTWDVKKILSPGQYNNVKKKMEECEQINNKSFRAQRQCNKLVNNSNIT